MFRLMTTSALLVCSMTTYAMEWPWTEKDETQYGYCKGVVVAGLAEAPVPWTNTKGCPVTGPSSCTKTRPNAVCTKWPCAGTSASAVLISRWAAANRKTANATAITATQTAIPRKTHRKTRTMGQRLAGRVADEKVRETRRFRHKRNRTLL